MYVPEWNFKNSAYLAVEIIEHGEQGHAGLIERQIGLRIRLDSGMVRRKASESNPGRGRNISGRESVERFLNRMNPSLEENSLASSIPNNNHSNFRPKREQGSISAYTETCRGRGREGLSAFHSIHARYYHIFSSNSKPSLSHH